MVQKVYLNLVHALLVLKCWCCVCIATIATIPLVESFAASTTTTANTVHTNNHCRIYYDSSNHLHRDISFHYENPERITVCIEALYKYATSIISTTIDSTNSIELIDIAPTIHDSIRPQSFQNLQVQQQQHILLRDPVSDDEVQYARSLLLETHLSDLILSIEEKCVRSQEQRIKDGKKSSLGYIGYLDGGDTYLTTETFNVCVRALIAWIRAVNYCVSPSLTADTLSASCFAMACTRPPGHHATYDLQNGFCLYNFAVASAIHALSSSVTANIVSRVSILDWDVHYGQGITDIVRSSKYSSCIRYVSIHQTPAFPYEGERNQRSDNVMTLPIPPETTWTCGYSSIFEKAIQFCYSLGNDDDDDEWDADLIIICAGYDALSNDELASVNLDATDYSRMVQRLCQYIKETIHEYNNNNNGTKKIKKPKIMLGLEGGYKLNDGGSSGNLPDAVVATIQSFLEQTYI